MNNLLVSTKICVVCKENKDVSLFYRDKDTGYPTGSCKSCQAKSSKNRFIKYKQDAVNYLGGRCCICGYCRYIGALEFHHLIPELKSCDYYAMRNWSFDRKKEELDKCVLLCSNCHKEVEAGLIFMPLEKVPGPNPGRHIEGRAASGCSS